MTMDEEKLIERCRSYGADVEGVMERLGHDVELYQSCLHLFVEDNNFQMFSYSMETEDYRKAFHAAHTLKGVSANLGLTPMYDAVSHIVDTLRQEQYDNIADRWEKVLYERERVKELLEQ